MTLTPAEYEQKLLELENKPANEPLDVHAAMVKYYIPRLKAQIVAMSKKQLIILATDLAGSSYNDDADIRKIIVMTKDMGLGAVQRVINGVIVNPFDEIELRLTVEKEKNLFTLFDSLLTNKYLNCLANGLSQAGDNKKQELADFILHKIDINSREFKKRIRVETDCFFTSNALLCSKYLMILVKTNEFREKEKQNG